MCTVSYVPHKKGFVLTSNRDENIKRKSALGLEYYNFQNKRLLFPKDREQGGTWMVTDGKGFSLCLFNGAYENHKKKASYRKSRGTIVLDFFAYQSVLEFVTCYNFQEIEPFSVVMVQHRPLKTSLLLWDGKNTNWQQLNEKEPHIWASVTLYEKAIIEKKKKIFLQKLNREKAGLEQLVDIHKNTSVGDMENDFVMKRNDGMQTISITSIENKEESIRMYYEDLLENTSALVSFDE